MNLILIVSIILSYVSHADFESDLIDLHKEGFRGIVLQEDFKKLTKDQNLFQNFIRKLNMLEDLKVYDGEESHTGIVTQKKYKIAENIKNDTELKSFLSNYYYETVRDYFNQSQRNQTDNSDRYGKNQNENINKNQTPENWSSNQKLHRNNTYNMSNSHSDQQKRRSENEKFEFNNASKNKKKENENCGSDNICDNKEDELFSKNPIPEDADPFKIDLLKQSLTKNQTKEKNTGFESKKSLDSKIDNLKQKLAHMNITYFKDNNTTDHQVDNNQNSVKPKKIKHKIKKKIIELTESNFKKKVLKDTKNIWFVRFHAHWCKHCINSYAEWKKFAKIAPSYVKVADIEVTNNQRIFEQAQVNGFPTFKLFLPTHTKLNKGLTYQGPRDANSYKNFVSLYKSQIKKKSTSKNNDKDEKKIFK